MNLKLLLLGLSKKWSEGIVSPGTTVESQYFGSDVPNLEYEFYSRIATHNIIRSVMQAEQDGFDAAVIGCFADPGLKEARELVRIPVIGVAEASLHLACVLSAGRFSVVVPRRKHIPKFADNARIYGVESRIASWRSLDLAVSELWDPKPTEAAILREARAAIDGDGAEVVCLGCTAMVGQAARIQEQLGVPVLDPVVIGLTTAEFQATLWQRFGISHSKNGGYESPPAAEMDRICKAQYGAINSAAKKLSNGLFCRF
jgi:allantoin racemase